MAIVLFIYLIVNVVAMHVGIVLRTLIGPTYEGFSFGRNWYRVQVDFLDGEDVDWEVLL